MAGRWAIVPCVGTIDLGFHHRHSSLFREQVAVEHREAGAHGEERVIFAHPDAFPRVELEVRRKSPRVHTLTPAHQ